MARKRRRNSDEKPADIGMVMTVSLFLILLTFFILLNSIAVLDERRVRLTIGSLIGAFGSLPGGLSPIRTGESVMPPSAPILEKELDLSQLLAAMENHRVIGNIAVRPIKGGEIITIAEQTLFFPNSADFRPGARDLLDQLSIHLNKGDYPIDIVGHTDGVSANIKGFESNWELSSLMAARVHAYLADHCGVGKSRVTSYGLGDTEPVTAGETPESRLENRRIEIAMHYDMPSYVRRIFNKKPSGTVTYKRFNFKVF